MSLYAVLIRLIGIAGIICLTTSCVDQIDIDLLYVIELNLMAELKEIPGEIEYTVEMGAPSPRILRDRRAANRRLRRPCGWPGRGLHGRMPCGRVFRALGAH